MHARGYGRFCGPDRGHSPVGEQAAESAHTAGPGLETTRVWHLLYVVVDSAQEAWDEVRDDRRRRVVGVSDDDLVAELAQQHGGFVDRRAIPACRVLLGQRHIVPVIIAPCAAPCIGVEHQREEAQRLGLARQVGRHQLGEEDGFGGQLYIMQSNCGVDSLAATKAIPIAMVESGPASGVWGAAELGRLIGELNVLALDIGGTTAKCSLIEGGQVDAEHRQAVQRRLEQ